MVVHNRVVWNETSNASVQDGDFGRFEVRLRDTINHESSVRKAALPRRSVEGGFGNSARDLDQNSQKTHGVYHCQAYGSGGSQRDIQRLEYPRMDDSEEWLGYSHWKSTQHPAFIAESVWHYYTFQHITTGYSVVGHAPWSRTLANSEYSFSA